MLRKYTLFIILGAVTGLFTMLQAQQESFMEFKAGFLRPKDTAASNLLGISVGRNLDERLYWGVEANYMSSTYRKTTTIAELDSGNITFRDKQLELEFRTRILTLLLQASFQVPLDYGSSVFFRASAGGGLQVVWNEENNFVERIERSRTFSGLGWQLTSGLGLQISQRGIIFVDAIYNYAVLSKSQGESDLGLPTFREIDLSGFGVRAGIRLTRSSR